MRICSNCGNPLEEGGEFCTFCGAPVPPEPTTEFLGGFCPNCGGLVDENTVFCGNCGFKIKETDIALVKESVSVQSVEQAVVPKRRNPVFVIICSVLAVLILAGGLLGYRYISVRNQCEKFLAQAEEYMENDNYEEAKKAYQQILNLDSHNQKAGIGLARIFLYEEEYEEAEKLLESIQTTEKDEIWSEYQKLMSVSRFQPEIIEVDAEHFPNVTVNLSCGGELSLTDNAVAVTDNGKDYPAFDVHMENGSLSLNYEAEDTGISGEERELALRIQVEDFTFHNTVKYETPIFQDAEVKLVSTDVSEYPVVKTYFRVRDSISGSTIEGLDSQSFIIHERLTGGEYLSREIHSALSLDGNAGLNLALVADKSSSISEYDMEKIKAVMTNFVNSLHYEVGDKAEVLAFDSIVQQMCYYTDDNDLLVNGIRNMSADGLTAFYDAVYNGITHAALQGGARCVIAFTDGMDNRSLHNAYDVIQYANTSQVPVYIIGVGSQVETYILQDIASNTGGRYWHIDDLYDLEEIFNEIYTEQKKLYSVEYISDSSQDAYQNRDLQVLVNGQGYRARDEISFQPVYSLGNENHTSRYEVFKEALTWEEATERCQQMGGHLATITSQDEMDLLIQMAEAEDISYVWLGGYTSYDNVGNVFGHWVTGEDFTFQIWSKDEPSRVDLDGVEEWYIMLWNVPSLGGWSWNDQRNDPVSVSSAMAEKMGFICEFEE